MPVSPATATLILRYYGWLRALHTLRYHPPNDP